MTPNSRFGQYQVIARLGQGGMGEVFRARDTRLNRDVAIKVLPAEFASDRERLHRFDQEARSLAALNHPNVLVIYDTGLEATVPFLVTELLEGATLREVLNGSTRLPQRKILEYAQQAANGLTAAHSRGIVHRDLKPENIFITSDERLKILDFGLAKVRNKPQEDAPKAADLNAATVQCTQPGVVMGTAAYMSPEQVRGEEADHRSDIFAFGSILHELFTGQPLFKRESPVESMNAILTEPVPELSELRADVPPGLARTVQRCLEKLPERRFQSASDLAFALEALSGSNPAAAPVRDRRQAKSSTMVWASITLAMLAFLLLGWWKMWTPNNSGVPTGSPGRMHLPIAVPAASTLIPYYGPLVAISPDGMRVAFAAEDTNGVRRLWVQTLTDPQPVLLPGSETAIGPYFSPDGTSIAFTLRKDLGLKVVSLESHSSFVAGDLIDGACLGGCWGSDGILYQTPSWTAGIWKYSASRRFSPAPVTKTDPKAERAHLWPDLSPDGKLLLYTVWNGGSFSTARIAVESLVSHQRHFLYTGASSAKFAASNLIVFGQDGALLAATFDSEKMQLTTAPQSVLGGVMMDPRDGGGQYSLTRDGSLVYLPGTSQPLPRRLVRVDREGKVTPWSEYVADAVHATLSPDNTRVAMAVAAAGELDVYVVGRGHGLPLRISTGGDDFWPCWSADGKRVIWNSGRDGDPQLYWRAADASDEEERLTTGPGYKRRCSFTPNGQAVAFTAPAGFVSALDGQAATNSVKGSDDIWVLPLSGDRVPYPLISTRYNEQEPQFSPDGKMIAYQSDETGANEIWIQPIVIEGPLVRKAGTSRQVTLSGGQGPRWASSSRELFYRDTRSFFTVPSESVDSFQPGAPRRMFNGEFEEGWEVEKDGPNFVMLQNGPEYPRLNAYRYVAHWVDDVRRRLGTRARP